MLVLFLEKAGDRCPFSGSDRRVRGAPFDSSPRCRADRPRGCAAVSISRAAEVARGPVFLLAMKTAVEPKSRYRSGSRAKAARIEDGVSFSLPGGKPAGPAISGQRGSVRKATAGREAGGKQDRGLTCSPPLPRSTRRLHRTHRICPDTKASGMPTTPYPDSALQIVRRPRPVARKTSMAMFCVPSAIGQHAQIPGCRRYGFNATLIHSSSLSRNVLDIAGPFPSGTLCMITKEGLICPS